MARVMLIKPAYETDAVWDTIRTSHPLGLWWIGSALREEGHEVRILDETVRKGGYHKRKLLMRHVRGKDICDEPLDTSFEAFDQQRLHDFYTLTPEEFVRRYSAYQREGSTRVIVRTGNPLEETLEEVTKFNPHYLGIPVFASVNYPSALALAFAVKSSQPSVNIVLGGQHVSALPEDAAQQPFVDHVITGDAIHAFKALVRTRKGQKIIVGGIQDISSFPLLDMSLMEENTYPAEPSHSYATGRRQYVDHMFSKGCFRDCEFCVAGEREHVISRFAFKKIEAQLERFRSAGIEEIIVQDDAFLFKPNKNLREYLALMKNQGLYWQDNGGIEFEGLTDEVIEMLMHYQTTGAGRINALYVPLNPRTGHAHESVIKSLRERFAHNFPHIKRLRESGIYTYTSEIIGYPGKTTALMWKDIYLHQVLVKEGYVAQALTFVTSTLPGTKLYREHAGHIVEPQDWAAYSNFVPQSTTEDIPSIHDIERLTINSC